MSLTPSSNKIPSEKAPPSKVTLRDFGDLWKRKKFSELIKSPIITVLVGEEEEKFHVHEALLTGDSELMTKALEGPYNERTENTVKLPSEDPLHFGYFIFWVYHRINFALSVPSEFRIDLLADYVALYALGERLASKNFQTSIVKLLHRRWDKQSSSAREGWMDEPIKELIDAVAIAMTDLIENEEDDMQKYLLWVWYRRQDGPNGWIGSAYFHRKLRQYPDLESNLRSEKRARMMAMPQPKHSLDSWPQHACAYELT